MYIPGLRRWRWLARGLAVVLAHFSGSHPAPAATPGDARGTHWAFVPPKPVAPPAVRNNDWVRNPVDRFVLARLDALGWTPAPEAARETLIRRVYLDLIGLPPSPEELDAALADQRPAAWEELVDRLLGSPHFGERWGRHWLDLARYADSSGYQIDRFRPGAFRYRDWVVDAFNRDLPFDQFTIEQLAGDLLPGATEAQRIATGFHRMTLENFEDGVDREEFRVKAKIDRVGTTATAWLGLTLACAECHNHKYDPVSQTEFYQVYAVFNQAAETELASKGVPDAPVFHERNKEVKTFIHVRGDFLRPGAEVQPGALRVLHPFQSRGSRADRLDLARWIASPANPLTARVAVNHVWLHLFGRGLVSTPEDFGTRADPPSHPGLLDWLAIQFTTPVADSGLGWSRKGLIRLLATSATYRQSSVVDPSIRARDPQNVWLARQSRLRVEAEILRDLHLAAAGQLNPRIGGPSFRPPMPADLLHLGYRDRGIQWVESTGPERFRRGVYIQTQRTIPYPVPMTFDGANASEACVQRDRSNTPLQALTLLNNPVFLDAARTFGRRIDACGGATDAGRVRYACRVALARLPEPAEAELLTGIYRAAREKAPGSAGTVLAQVLFNLDEFFTRE